MDVWGEGEKGLDVFKIFVLSTFFLRIFCKETLSCSFRLLYIYILCARTLTVVVSDISCPCWSMVMESTSRKNYIDFQLDVLGEGVGVF